MVTARRDLDVVVTEQQNGRETLVVDRPVYGANNVVEAARSVGWSEGQIGDGLVCAGVTARRTKYGHAVRARFHKLRGGGFQRSRDGRLEAPAAYSGSMEYCAMRSG